MKRFEGSPDAEIRVCVVLGDWDRRRAREACGALRDEILRAHGGPDHPASEIRRTDLGKPYLPDLPQLDWSASSCEGAIGIATCIGGRVGLDLESPRTELVDDRLVRACFSAEEYELWRDLIRQDPSGFFEIWVRKEAALKCLGVGLHGEPRRTSVGRTGEGWVRGACGDAGVFHVRSLEGLTNMSAAVASDRPRPISLRVRLAEEPRAITGPASAR